MARLVKTFLLDHCPYNAQFKGQQLRSDTASPNKLRAIQGVKTIVAMQSQAPLPSFPSWSIENTGVGEIGMQCEAVYPEKTLNPTYFIVPHTFLDKQPDPSSEKVSRALWAPYLLEMLGGCNLLSAGHTAPSTMEVHWSGTRVNRATNLYRCKVLVV